MTENQLESNYSSLIFNSYKTKILNRILNSVRHYLLVKDLDRVEAGLITALNLVGFISQDILEVNNLLFLILKIYLLGLFSISQT
jgi:hypothetical protein